MDRPLPGDHQHGRHPGRHRARLVGQLHHGAAQGAARLQAATSSHPRELAEQACHIEIDRLGEPIGKQDQYIAAFGGITCFSFLPGRHGRGLAAASSAPRRSTTSRTTCCCSSPATRRSASAILKEQDERSRAGDAGDDREPALREGAGPTRARQRSGGGRPAARSRELMNVHWEHKKSAAGP